MKERGHSGSDSSPGDDGYDSDRWEEVSAEGSSTKDDGHDDGDDDDDSYTDFDEASEPSSPSPSSSSSSSSSSATAATTAVVAAGAGDARRREMLASNHNDDSNISNTARQGNDEVHNPLVPEQDSSAANTQHPVVVCGPGPASSVSGSIIPSRLTQTTTSPPPPLPEQGAYYDQQSLDASAAAPPLPGGADGARQSEVSGDGDSFFTGKDDFERANSNSSNNNGRATPAGAVDVAAATPLVEGPSLLCGTLSSCCSSLDPFENRNNITSVPPVSSPSEEPEEEEYDDVEFALLERHLARLGVPPAFSPRRASPPCLKTCPTIYIYTTNCWSENHQTTSVDLSTPLAGGNGSGQTGVTARGTNQTPGVKLSTLLLAGKRGHQTEAATCTRQPIILVDCDNNNKNNNSSSSSSAVTRRSARRWNDHPQSEPAASTAQAAARSPSATSAVGCNGSGGASLVGSRISQKHGLTTYSHVAAVDGEQPSAPTTTTTPRRRDNKISSSGGVAAAGAVPKSPPLEDLPAARDCVGSGEDSEDDDPSRKAANVFVGYPTWREDKGPSFSDELRAVASDIRRQTRLGTGKSSLKNAERNWDGICQQRSSKGGERYHQARLNRSKRFVRRSLIGRIGALAAMENLRYPPGCSSQNWTAVERMLPREGSGALGSSRGPRTPDTKLPSHREPRKWSPPPPGLFFKDDGAKHTRRRLPGMF